MGRLHLQSKMASELKHAHPTLSAMLPRLRPSACEDVLPSQKWPIYPAPKAIPSVTRLR